MVNQILAIYFLSDLDRFIKEKLKIRYLVRYQDDFLLNLSYDKKLITEKKYHKLALALDDIVKYTSGWLKKISNN